MKNVKRIKNTLNIRYSNIRWFEHCCIRHHKLLERMGGTRIFEVGGSEGQGGKNRGKQKLLLSDFQLRKTSSSSRCFGR